MSEGVHLPAHGKFPAWGWYLIGGLLVYLLIKKNASVASMVVPGGGASQALRSDVNPRQAAAENLRNEHQQKQNAFDEAMNALNLQVKQAQSTVVTDYAKFYNDLATGQPYGGGKGGIKCPSGKPRIDPMTGRVYCRDKVGGGFHWDDGVRLGVQIYEAISGVPPTGGTPPINPNSGGLRRPNSRDVAVARGSDGGIVTPASVLWCDNDC